MSKYFGVGKIKITADVAIDSTYGTTELDDLKNWLGTYFKNSTHILHENLEVNIELEDK